MRPIVHGLEDEYGDRIEFVYLNIDDPNTREAKEKYGYRVQPHFFLVAEDDEVILQWLGVVQGEEFEQAFDEVLGN